MSYPVAYHPLPHDLVPVALDLRRGLAVKLAKVIESRAPIPDACASALAEGVLSTLDTLLPDALLKAYQMGKGGR